MPARVLQRLKKPNSFQTILVFFCLYRKTQNVMERTNSDCGHHSSFETIHTVSINLNSEPRQGTEPTTSYLQARCCTRGATCTWYGVEIVKWSCNRHTSPFLLEFFLEIPQYRHMHSVANAFSNVTPQTTATLGANVIVFRYRLCPQSGAGPLTPITLKEAWASCFPILAAGRHMSQLPSSGITVKCI